MKIIYLILLSTVIIYLCRGNYIYIYERFCSMLPSNNDGSIVITDIGDRYYDQYIDMIGHMINNVGMYFINIGEKFNSFNNFGSYLIIYLMKFLTFITNSLVYIFTIIEIIVLCNILRKVYLHGRNDKYKDSKYAKALVNINLLIKRIVLKYNQFIKDIFEYKRKEVILIGLLCLVSSGIVFDVLFDTLIWMINYLLSFIKKEYWQFNVKFIVWFFGAIVNVFITNTKATNIILLILFLYSMTIARSYRRLSWNKSQRINSIFKVAGTLNLFNGAPSSGKTKSITILTQDAEELMIEELEECLLDLEERLPDYNLTYLIFLLNIKYGFYDKEDIKIILEKNNELLLDIQKMESYFKDVSDEVEYAFYLLYKRGSFMASNYSIVDPSIEDENVGEDGYNYSHALDMNAFRWYKKIEKMYFEPYMAIAIQEMDKEFNSHKDMKQINEEGTAVAFSAITHVCERHVYIFADYQLKDQVPARIRGNAIAQFWIKDSKTSYPFFIKIYRFLVGIPYFHLKNVIKEYRTTKEYSDEKSLRKKPFEYKRNYVSLYYQIVKYLAFILGNIYSYFERFRFTRLNALYTYKDSFDDKDVKEYPYYINDCELQFKNHRIYDSCNLGGFFNELKNDKLDKSSIVDLPNWPNLNPGYKFYMDNVHQHFYSDMVDAQFKEDEKESNNDLIDKDKEEEVFDIVKDI